MNVATQWEDNINYAVLPFNYSYGVSFRVAFWEPTTLTTIVNDKKIQTIISTNSTSVHPNNLSTPSKVQSGIFGFGVDHSFENLVKSEIKIYDSLGLNNIKSIGFRNLTYNTYTHRFDLGNLSELLYQFPNLYSFQLYNYFYNNNAYKTNINIDFATIPEYIKEVVCKNVDFTGSITYNLNNIPSHSQLEYFYWDMVYVVNDSLVINGDLGNLPMSVKYFKVAKVTTSSVVTYSGKIWNSELDTFYFNKVLTTFEIDMLLNDMASSISTAIGDKIIYLRGSRTSDSDSAVSILQSRGFTITITP